MSSDGEDIYIIRETAAEGDGDGWVAPEPAEDVITEQVLTATDLDRETVEPLTEHVDFEALAALLSGGRDEELTFTIEGYAVAVDSSGAVKVTAEN